MGSYLAVLGGALVLLLLPAYLEAFIPLVPFNLASVVVLMLFFLPFFWWRTTVGYLFAIVYGIVLTGARTVGPLTLVAEGTLPVESLIILIPNIVFALLLIAGSVLAWREG